MKSKFSLIIIVICAVFSLVACQKKTPVPDSELAMEQNMVKQQDENRIYVMLLDFSKAYNTYNAQQIMSFYADDAAITSLDGQTWSKNEQAQRMDKVTQMLKHHSVVQNVVSVRNIEVIEDNAKAMMEVEVRISGHKQAHLLYDLELAKRHGDWYLTKSITKKL